MISSLPSLRSSFLNSQHLGSNHTGNPCSIAMAFPLSSIEKDKYDINQPYFVEAEEGWHGYIEWEKYPERKKKAAEMLSQHKFAGVSGLLSISTRIDNRVDPCVQRSSERVNIVESQTFKKKYNETSKRLVQNEVKWQWLARRCYRRFRKLEADLTDLRTSLRR